MIIIIFPVADRIETDLLYFKGDAMKRAVLLCLVGVCSGVVWAQSNGFQHFGNFKRMMHTGDSSGQVNLNKLNQTAGTWGVGALAGLKGEIVQVDGRILVSLGKDPDGRVQPPSNADAAALWASETVAGWEKVSVPEEMSQSRFEKFVSEQAVARKLDLSQPFTFRVTGSYSHLIWHVVTGEKASSGAHTQQKGHHGEQSHGGGHANKQSGMLVFRNPTATGQLVAVYSGEKLEGIVSHPGEHFHVHYIDDSENVSGHVDQYNVQKGSTLWLPVR